MKDSFLSDLFFAIACGLLVWMILDLLFQEPLDSPRLRKFPFLGDQEDIPVIEPGPDQSVLVPIRLRIDARTLIDLVARSPRKPEAVPGALPKSPAREESATS